MRGTRRRARLASSWAFICGRKRASGARGGRVAPSRRGRPPCAAQLRKFSTSWGSTTRAGELAKNLPHGHQRALGVAIALAAKLALLLLDEPMAGMNAEETTAFMALLRRIRESGVTILLVEHDMVQCLRCHT